MFITFCYMSLQAIDLYIIQSSTLVSLLPPLLLFTYSLSIWKALWIVNQGRRQPRKGGVERDRIYCQKVYLTIFMSFLLRNQYRPEVKWGGHVHPSPPRGAALVVNNLRFYQFSRSSTVYFMIPAYNTLQ